jgi:hypothetical protein
MTLVWTPGYDDGSTYTPGKLVLKKDSVAATDTNINEVSLLLHGDGTNGSTTITDSSLTPKTVTAVGNAQISTAQSKFGGASILLDGSGDYLDVGSNSAFGYGLSDFTIETWVYRNVSSALQVIVDQRAGVAIQLVPTLYINATTLFYYANGNNRITGGVVPDSQWVHIALSRSGTSTKLFMNGLQTGATYTDTLNYINSPARIGDRNDGAIPTASLNGYIDDFRITKVCRYTSNFTPPTAPFPNY